MTKKIKVKVGRYFIKTFVAEAKRRDLSVHLEMARDGHTDQYVMDTPLGRMRLAADASPIMMHVYRKFEDVDRACGRLGDRQEFNRHSGKWNVWLAGSALDTDAKGSKLPKDGLAATNVRAFVNQVFAEVDALNLTND